MNAFPVDRVRAEFPALAIVDGTRARIYVDNPAGTQVPARVAQAVSRCLIETNANLGGYFTTSVAAQEVFSGAHRAMARFLGAASEREVILGPSMTTLTFALSRSIGRTLKPGDEIVVTRMDHDGNISPWLAMAEDRGVTVRWLPFDEESWVIEPQALDAVLSERTRLVALNHASNLTGSINDVRNLVRRIHSAGALAYVDSVQFAPHGAIDVREIGCDFLACSSYKFFGPHLGIVWGREDLLHDLYAYKVRPQTTDLPDKFETGTPQIESLAGLTATVEYFEWLGASCTAGVSGRDAILAAFEAASSYERELTARLIEGLQQMDGVRIAGITDPASFASRVPTVSFTHARLKPAEIAQALAAENVFVWSGHNFALEVVRQLGIDETQGVVRIGLAHYNTMAEVERVLDALRRALPLTIFGASG
jgi:cysteine desulfurase family protein (TIGR01976 family)